MAKIMAKSCGESRCWPVRLGSQPRTGRCHPHGMGRRRLWGREAAPVHSRLQEEGFLTVPRGKGSHGKKRPWDMGSNPAPLFASSHIGPHVSLLWACARTGGSLCALHSFICVCGNL